MLRSRFLIPCTRTCATATRFFQGFWRELDASLSVSGQGQTERAEGELVSGNYFEVLGVRPAIGRLFSMQDETAPGANPVAVLSYGYWTRHFGNDPAILNKQININGTSLTIVGVSQAGFTGIQLGRIAQHLHSRDHESADDSELGRTAGSQGSLAGVDGPAEAWNHTGEGGNRTRSDVPARFWSRKQPN